MTMFIIGLLLGLAVIPFIEELKLQWVMHNQRKEEKLEALVSARINAKELAAWGIICSTPGCTLDNHGHAHSDGYVPMTDAELKSASSDEIRSHIQTLGAQAERIWPSTPDSRW
jgi:hypothetical protein